MKIKNTILLLLLLCTTISFSQDQAKVTDLLFNGVVMDGDSLHQLPFTKFVINDAQGSIANDKGQFSFWATSGDVVEFSHIGYKSFFLTINDSLSKGNYLIGVFLKKDTIELSEVVIFPRNINPNAIVRNLPLLSTQEELAAQQNVDRSAYQAKTQPVTKWDAEMNQKNFIQARSNDIAYKTQVQPDHMVGVSNTSVNKHIETKKLSDNAIKPQERYITQSEWDYLVATYKERQRLKLLEAVE